MSKYTLFSPGSYSEEFISSLQEMGVVDISRSHKAIDERSEALMEKAADIRARISGVAIKRELEEINSYIAELEKEEKSALIWGDYDASRLEELAGMGYTTHFHIVSSGKFNAGWAADLPLEVIADDGRQVIFVILGDNNGIPGEVDAPRTVLEIGSDKALAIERKTAAEKALSDLENDKKTLQAEYDNVMADLDAYLARKATMMDEGDELGSYLDIFEGFAPLERQAEICAALDSMPIYYIVEEASGDDTPIKLHNNWFARQFEVFTGMYGLPVYGEFDPTPILAPFYLLFFGMCMGDAGYGLLLMLIALLLKKKAPDSGLGRMHSLIFLLGAGTFVIGAILGTFFGINLFEASWAPQWLKRIMPVEGNIGRIAGFDPQIILAICIGIFHICLAMIVKTVCYTKHYGFTNSLSTWGWTILVVGGVITAAMAVGGLLGSDALRWTIIAIAVISSLGILVFNKPGRNPLLNIGAGLWDAYSSITGLLSDVLSYIRLYALGLAGGMLGGVFNSLALMILGDNPTWHWLPFIILLLVGHGLNIALSALGAFVHPLRLSFVEYFKNSGYEGKGRRYQPLTKNK